MKQFKKLLAVSMLAATVLTVGCGSNAKTETASTPAATTTATATETAAVTETPAAIEGTSTPAATETAAATDAQAEEGKASATLSGVQVTVDLPEGYKDTKAMAGTMTLQDDNGNTILVMSTSVPGAGKLEAKTYEAETAKALKTQPSQGTELLGSGLEKTALGDIPYFSIKQTGNGVTIQQLQFHVIDKDTIYMVAAQTGDGSAVTDTLKATAIKVLESMQH